MSAVAPSICPVRTASTSLPDPDQVQCRPQAQRMPRSLVRVGVRRAWPEEATETVTLGPGHDMHMQVNDALADGVVHCDKGALRAEAFDHCRGQPLTGFK